MPPRTFLQAIVDAQAEEMRRDPRVFVMGEDVRMDLFGKTTGLLEEFGPERVRDTPICEATIVGAAVGAAMTGTRPIVDLALASFLYLAMDQLVNMASKIRYMTGGQARVPMVVRAALSYRRSGAAQHSDRNYPMFMNVPGLKIAIPSTPADAKGLLKTAIRSDDVVLFFEDSSVASGREDVADETALVPFGVASRVRTGTDVTIVAIGGSVPQAGKAADRLATMGISAELIDPRTLVPLDEETILRSVAKTGRLVIVEPAHRTCGAGAEIASIVAERGFADLRAPVRRLTAPQTHVPFSITLERALYPTMDGIVTAARAVCGRTS